MKSFHAFQGLDASRTILYDHWQTIYDLAIAIGPPSRTYTAPGAPFPTALYDMQKRLFPRLLLCQKLSSQQPQQLDMDVLNPESAEVPNFSVHCLGTKVSPLSLLRASELMIIMMESPRSPNPSPNVDTRHGTVSVQGVVV